ncbi:PP2C family protein-serine/threonine phosphatase [Marinobacter litoralis]|uniref:PP2C family protein-serine/threonine phosphatase n=1 Tax=Marinobacter litoralis TaxID=187981 RepID=UPI0018EAC17F|nr:SpoIIE family protein phosphatase [Marinobacter litoralis]MBJ6137835.1 SpoIIE family protein phosphatase [Marinobacter litoralis]
MTSRTERILIIDANEQARSDLSRYLDARGFYVSVCPDIGTARSLFAANMPDAIFADLAPTVIDDLCRRLDAADSYTPIIAYTQSTSSAQVVELLRAGAEDIVLKPCSSSKDALDDVIEKLFDRIRVNRLNKLYREELEEANRDLRSGIAELRADQNAGRKVQLKMLPEHNQEICGLQADYLIKPSLYLSGDFLDYIRLTKDKVLVYIADVSGHGASSAFVTVLLKNLTNRLKRNLRRQSSDDIMHPRRILERINSELMDTGLGKHVTVFVGIITLSERTLSYAVGAHFPMPILSFEDGETRFLEGSGLPVGLFEDPEWELYEVKLDRPFRLLLFSDGILEVIPDKSLDEKERTLLELVSGGSHTIASLSEALGLKSISELPDDIAIVSVTDQLTGSDQTSST